MRAEAGLQPKSNSVHCSFKIWDLLATVLSIFLRIIWPDWHILCSLDVFLCFVWECERLPPCLRYWPSRLTDLRQIGTDAYSTTVTAAFTAPTLDAMQQFISLHFSLNEDRQRKWNIFPIQPTLRTWMILVASVEKVPWYSSDQLSDVRVMPGTHVCCG